MTESTDWEALKAKCVDHNATLSLRCETFTDQYRFSLSAVQASGNDKGKTLYDVRANDDGHAPQFVVTGMVTDALGGWWA